MSAMFCVLNWRLVYRAECRLAGYMSWLLLVISLSSVSFSIFVNLSFSHSYVVSTLVVWPSLLHLTWTQQFEILGCCVRHYGRKSSWVWRRIVWTEDGETIFVRNLGQCLPNHTTSDARGHYLYVDINVDDRIKSEGYAPLSQDVYRVCYCNEGTGNSPNLPFSLCTKVLFYAFFSHAPFQFTSLHNLRFLTFGLTSL
jgi:hypothetical protein